MAEQTIKQAFPLHETVFKGNLKELSKLLLTEDISLKDCHGNTALHLAVMLGQKECILLLLNHGAAIKVKNLQGWSPLAEAISYGDRQIITALLRKMRSQNKEAMDLRAPNLIKTLGSMKDFMLELRWDFQSWVPLVSRMLPSDICRLHKKGTKLRLDTTLVDFKDMKWERGDISFIYSAEDNCPLVALDNKQGVYQQIKYEDALEDLDSEIDILMSSDIISATVPTKNISFVRSKSGWVFRGERTEMVGNFKADYYTIHGLSIEQRKRREHLSEEDLQKNKQIITNLTKGNIVQESEIPHRSSLPLPPPSTVTWQEYISAPPGQPPPLGRVHVEKHITKHLKATLAMSSDYPMPISIMVDVLEVIAPIKQFSKLRNFLQSQLPPGFPIKIELPVFPTVTAKVTFQQFQWRDEIPDSLFLIPSHYTEDRHHFPDL